MEFSVSLMSFINVMLFGVSSLPVFALAAGAGVAAGGKAERLGFLAESRLQRHHQRFAQVPAVYIPEIGVANVTKPTAMPPIPQLYAWKDYQPIDTAIGLEFVRRFTEEPTVTPPPTQEALNLAFGCPQLLSWPSIVEVDGVASCDKASQGLWTSSGTSPVPIIRWNMSCSLATMSLSGQLIFSLPNGDLFGSSRTLFSLAGTVVQLYDCGGNPGYSIEQKIYHERGRKNDEACRRYQSCDGIVYIQYFMYDEKGTIVAMTKYLSIFQDHFEITDLTGTPIAQITRQGSWSPVQDGECSATDARKWRIMYSPGAPGIWATQTQQWPIAMMVTVMAHLDAQRQPSGLLTPTHCEVGKTILLVFVLIFISSLFCGCTLLFVNTLLIPFRALCITMEIRICTHRMQKPSRFERH